MSYIQRADYKKLIQADNLTQIINNDNTILDGVEALAEGEATTYLVQKYIISEEFTDLLAWNPATIYNAKQRVTLDALAYSPTAAYAIKDLTLINGNVYICTTAIIAPGEAFTPAHWTKLGLQFTIFFVTLPKPQFNFETRYNKGDQVFWRDKVYTNIIPTGYTSQEEAIQYPTYADIPANNIFPDDPTRGAANWGNGIAYSVAAGTLPTDATKWTAGDNRDPVLLNCVLCIALYWVHMRIAPRNVPDLRAKNYDDSITWLKRAAKGEITANLPRIQPKAASGQRVRWGSKPKRINNY